jgi:hypothetical protein
MKQVFQLSEPKFYQHFERQDDIIVWIFRWQGKTCYSQALKELIETNYFEN